MQEGSFVQPLALEAAGSRWNVRCMLCEPQKNIITWVGPTMIGLRYQGIRLFCYYLLCQLQQGQDVAKVRSRKKSFSARVHRRRLPPSLHKCSKVRE